MDDCVFETMNKYSHNEQDGVKAKGIEVDDFWRMHGSKAT